MGWATFAACGCCTRPTGTWADAARGRPARPPGGVPGAPGRRRARRAGRRGGRRGGRVRPRDPARRGRDAALGHARAARGAHHGGRDVGQPRLRDAAGVRGGADAGPGPPAHAGRRRRRSRSCSPDDDGDVLVYGIPYLDPDFARVELGRRARAAGPVAPGGGCARRCDRIRDDLAGRVTAVPARPAAAVGRARARVRHRRCPDGLRAGHPRRRRGPGPGRVFAGVDYVALGHLHGPQKRGRRRRHGPALLRVAARLLVLRAAPRQVDACWWTWADGVSVRTSLVAAPVPRRLADVTGTLDELLGAAGGAARRRWMRVTVTDATARTTCPPRPKHGSRTPSSSSTAPRRRGSARAAVGSRRRTTRSRSPPSSSSTSPARGRRRPRRASCGDALEDVPRWSGAPDAPAQAARCRRSGRSRAGTRSTSPSSAGRAVPARGPDRRGQVDAHRRGRVRAVRQGRVGREASARTGCARRTPPTTSRRSSTSSSRLPSGIYRVRRQPERTSGRSDAGSGTTRQQASVRRGGSRGGLDPATSTVGVPSGTGWTRRAPRSSGRGPRPRAVRPDDRAAPGRVRALPARQARGAARAAAEDVRHRGVRTLAQRLGGDAARGAGRGRRGGAAARVRARRTSSAPPRLTDDQAADVRRRSTQPWCAATGWWPRCGRDGHRADRRARGRADRPARAAAVAADALGARARAHRGSTRRTGAPRTTCARPVRPRRRPDARRRGGAPGHPARRARPAAHRRGHPRGSRPPARWRAGDRARGAARRDRQGGDRSQRPQRTA